MKNIINIIIFCVLGVVTAKSNPIPKSQQTQDGKDDRYFTTSDGVRMHYRVSGKGQPLVILPGYGQSASTFDKVYSGLEKYYTIYCLDYRWLGKSDSPAYGYHIERLATDAKEMIENAELKKFYLFGHSMGNAVSWCYFSIYGQDKVIKYILGDEAPCLIVNPKWSDEEKESFTGSKESRFSMFMTFGPSNSGNKDLRQEMMARLLTDHLVRDWRDIISTIRVPTMIVMGGKSHFASQLLWDWLNTNIKGSRLEIINDAGHGFYDSHPDIFNKLVIDFFK